MRIRPFFWGLLACVCIGVLILAANTQITAPAILSAQLQTPVAPNAVHLTVVELTLTDTQGLPIKEAQVSPLARMTNMEMVANYSAVSSPKPGHYTVHLHLDMAGPWEITISAHAKGFEQMKKTLFVEVQE